MNIGETTLYTKDAKDVVRVWSIAVVDGQIQMTFGQLHGTMQIKTEEVDEGKQGRSLEDQIRLRVSSRISKQIDKGYTADIMKANNMSNALGYRKPMLAKQRKDVPTINYAYAYCQHKYDGHRCVITKHEGKIIAYTRNGKHLTTIDHITNELHNRLGEGQTMDGELYCHGHSLQQITSWAKKKQDDTLRLMYYCYDMIAESPFFERLEMATHICKDVRNTIIVPTRRVFMWYDALAFYNESIKGGYEGTILRWGRIGYESKRTKHVVKLKGKVDDEFRVYDIQPSADGWGILHCETNDGELFTVSAPGTIKQKEYYLKNKHLYMGRYITVEYANLTKDRIPFHPVALRWKEEL